jgi:hypothetical protein
MNRIGGIVWPGKKKSPTKLGGHLITLKSQEPIKILSIHLVALEPQMPYKEYHILMTTTILEGLSDLWVHNTSRPRASIP